MARVVHTPRGLAALKARLAALPVAAAQAAGPALGEVAEKAAADVRAALDDTVQPADPRGTLAAAVTVEADDRGASVSVDLPYAGVLEFGTARRPARPFLRPAALAAGHAARGRLAGAIRAAIDGDPP